MSCLRVEMLMVVWCEIKVKYIKTGGAEIIHFPAIYSLYGGEHHFYFGKKHVFQFFLISRLDLIFGMIAIQVKLTVWLLAILLHTSIWSFIMHLTALFCTLIEHVNGLQRWTMHLTRIVTMLLSMSVEASVCFISCTFFTLQVACTRYIA